MSANPQWPADVWALIAAPADVSQVIIGAAGSGKTTLLVERAGFLVEHAGVHPDQVRVLTPSRQQATRLRDQVATRVARATRGPMAKSVASLAFDIVSADHVARGLAAPTLRSGADIDEDIRSLLTDDASGDHPFSGLFDPLVISTETFRTELRELMARVIEHGHTPDDLIAWGETYGKPEWQRAGAFMADYMQVIARSRPTSFEPAELIIRAARIVSTGLPPDFADLRVLLVDDSHDIPASARTLLREFSRWGVSVTAVGDPDSAGQTFRGSDPDSPTALADLLSVQPSYLPEVFRHGPTLRQAVTTLTSRVGSARAGQQRHSGATGVDHDTPVRHILADSATGEDDAIVSLISYEHLHNGVPLDQIAVISRRSGALTGVARALGQRDIPTALATRPPLSAEPAARELLWWALVGCRPDAIGSEQASSLLTGMYGGWTTLELRRLATWIRFTEAEGDTRRPAADVIRDVVVGKEVLIDAPPVIATLVERTRKMVAAISAAATASSVDQVLSAVWEAVGVEEQWLQRYHAGGEGSGFAARCLDAVVALTETATRFAGSHPGVSADVFITRLLDQDVAEDVIVPEPVTQAVWLGTPSGAAGRQWGLVIMHGVSDGVWPNTRLRGSLLGAPQIAWLSKGVPPADIDQRKVVLDDEIRMAALAASRATKQLVVSAISAEDTVPSPLFHLLADGTPQWQADLAGERDVRSLVARLRRRLTSESTGGEREEATQLAYLASRDVVGAHPEQWWGLAPPTTTQPLFAEEVVRLSPSKVANVEQSPLMWLLDTIAPEPLPPAVNVGAIIHKALEENPWGPASAMTELVDKRWADIPFDSAWLSEAQRVEAHRQVAALDSYLTDQKQQGIELVASEERFDIELPGALLTGFVDRVVRDVDGRLIVVDLKTGRYKTDGQVVDDAQLLAYQLAITTREVTDGWGIDQGPTGGAYLLYVSSGKGGKPYRIALQAPLDEEGRQVFIERLEQVRETIASHQFGLGEGSPRIPGRPPTHRWHLIGQVCGE